MDKNTTVFPFKPAALIAATAMASALVMPTLAGPAAAADHPPVIVCDFPAVDDQPEATVLFYLAAFHKDGSSIYRNLSANFNQVMADPDGLVAKGPGSCKGKNLAELKR